LTSNILSQYYEGILQRLRSEVDFINTLFEHQGVKGEGNEAVLRELIRKFIPDRFGIGTGVVVDRFGNQSRQCDIVVYDAFSYPSLLSLASVHLFPVDIVYATIEVKTTLDAASAKEARQNVASVKKLSVLQGEFMLIEQKDGGAAFVSYKPISPLGVVFAYNSNIHQFETFKNWFAPSKEADSPLLPTIVGCLDQGIIKFTDLAPESGTQPRALAVPLAVPMPSGSLSTVVISPDTETGGSATFEGVTYPVKKVQGIDRLIDQSRVLLLFLCLLSDMLAAKRMDPTFRFSEHYLTEAHRLAIEV
jgi:hypothetical protein